MIKFSIPNVREIKAALAEQIEKVIPNKTNSVVVGIHEGTGNHENSNQTVATIGAINHFGNNKTPARPWLDVGVESGKKQYIEVIQETINKKGDLNDALNIVAVLAQSATQQYLVDLKTPANSPKTIKAKKSSNPLVDSGQLVQSIKSKIIKKSSKGENDVIFDV